MSLRGWDKARAVAEAELNTELAKLVEKYKVPCHKFILVTNVPFTGVRSVGTRDRVNIIIRSWLDRVPEVEVWDANDLARMLDADADTRACYLDDLLPGDLLRALLRNVTQHEKERTKVADAYLKSLVRSERQARAEEAGDESSLKLEKVFVDLDLQLNPGSLEGKDIPWIRYLTEIQHGKQRTIN